jgi:hypothetical protein
MLISAQQKRNDKLFACSDYPMAEKVFERVKTESETFGKFSILRPVTLEKHLYILQLVLYLRSLINNFFPISKGIYFCKWLYRHTKKGVA